MTAPITGTVKSAERPLQWLLVAILVVPALMFGVSAFLGYQSYFNDARERVSWTLDIVREHASKVFEAQALVIEQTQQIIAGMSDDAIRDNAVEIQRRLDRINDRFEQIEDIWIVDSAGNPVITGGTLRTPDAAVVATRSYFLAHRDGLQPHGTLFVGRVRPGIGAQMPVFAISKARDVVPGQKGFAGLIVITVQPNYFREFYAQVVTPFASAIALFRDDGFILARHPNVSDNDRVLTYDAFKAAVVENPNIGTYEALSVPDGRSRMIGYRKLDHYPVYVGVGVERQTVVSAWLRSTASHLIFGIPATLALFVLTRISRDRMRRESAALAALQVEAGRREETESQLRQVQKMEAVGRLTGGVAHDFNNLLTVITGSLDLLSRRLPPGDARMKRLVGNAMDGAMRAADLTRQLLAFARRQPLEPKPTDVNALIADMADLLERSLGEAVIVETSLAPRLWLVNVDPPQLGNAILNLAVNARDAMPSGGTLRIATRNLHLDRADVLGGDEIAAGDYVLITVSDTGSGIDPAIADQVFQPFFTTKPAGEGTGLGLSQVFGFVKQSGGHLRLDSKAGAGTTVRIKLPRHAAAHVPLPEPVVPASSDGARSRALILLVEDDDGVRETTLDALRELGHHVVAASGGEAGLVHLRSEAAFDLLITDVVMPGMDGRELARRARLKRPSLRVLFITGYTPDTVFENGMVAAGDNLLVKPFSFSQLADKIDAVVAG